MSDKQKKLLKDLALHNVDFVIANLDKINFGERDFVIKLAIRLIARKLQAGLKSKDFGAHFKDLLQNLATMGR